MNSEHELVDSEWDALGRADAKFTYHALIRTYNSATTLEATLACLRNQTVPPERIISIDSGSRDDTLRILSANGCEIYPYEGESFNYSAALNQGVAKIRAPWTLVISSHVAITSHDAIETLHAEILRSKAIAGSVNHQSSTRDVTVTTKNTFNGWNGLWNTCALYPTELLRQVPFDETLPTAEDQHLASRLLAAGHLLATLHGDLLEYQNPRTSRLKQRNEHVAIGYFSYPSLLGWWHIAAVGRDAVICLASGRVSLAYHHAVLAMRLTLARYRRPRFSSRYFVERKGNP